MDCGRVVEFILLVKNKPELYAKRLKRGKKKIIRHWEEIASQMSCSVQECIFKWRCLRNCYTRTFREGNFKSWYLAEHLAFLKPFVKRYSHFSIEDKKKIKISIEECEPTSSVLKHNQKSSIPNCTENLLKPKEVIETRNSWVLDHLHTTSEVQECSTTFEMFSRYPQTYSKKSVKEEIEIGMYESQIPDISNSRTYTIPSPTLTLGNSSICSQISILSSEEEGVKNINLIETGKTSKNDELPTSSNSMFLMSMLPDLNKLDERQQRIFKRKALELMESFFY